MNQTLFLSCDECAADLQRDLDGRECIERPGPPNTRLQRFAFHQFHRAEALPVLFANAEMIHSRDIWMPQRCRRACFTHESFACFRSALHPFRRDKLECDRTLQRRIDRAICDSHRTAAQFPSRPIVATLDPVIPESIRYRSEQFLVRLFRVIESDARQANHAATKTARKCSLQPRPALRTHRRASRLGLHQSAMSTSQRCRSSASTSDACATVPPTSSRKIARYLERSRATSLRRVVIGRPSWSDISSYGTAPSLVTERCEFNCLNSSSFPANAHSSASRSSAVRSSVSAHSRS